MVLQKEREETVMKCNRHRAASVLFLMLLQAPCAFATAAEEDELDMYYGDMSFVSIATSSQLWLRRAPAVATVITAEEIRAMGAVDIDQVLETVPGVHVSVSADGYSPLYIFRGIVKPPTNPQVLMLQNGIPMTISFAGDRGRYGSTIPVDNIARIEIIRGPGSALYGADAYAGVINVITKTAADLRGTELTVRGGSFHSKEASVQHGGKLGAVDVAAYFRVGSTDGFRTTVTADGATHLDNIFGNNASLAPGPVNVGHEDVDGSLDLAYGKWRLRAGYKLRDHMGTGAGIASVLDPVGNNRSERVTTDLSWLDPNFGQDWGVGLTAAYLGYREKGSYQLYPPGTVFPATTVKDPALAALLRVPLGTVVAGDFPNGILGFPQRDERQLRLSSFATYSGFNSHRLRFGLGHDDLNLYRTATTKNFFFNAAGVPVPTGPVINYDQIQPHIAPHRRTVNYFYAQDEWNFAPNWTLTAGARHDRYSDFGSSTNPRLALVWDAADDLTAKILYGRAFRAPAFTEQYGINPAASGNPSIQPETIDTFETVLAWQVRRNFQATLNVFRYRMRDIIRAVPNPTPPGATFANSGDQHGKGLELELAWDAYSSLRISGNYAYQRSIDDTTRADAGYAPHHHLYARVDWRFTGGWLASAQSNRITDRLRPANDPRPKPPDYTTVDVTVRSPHNQGQWDFSGSVRNLFQAKVIEPSMAPGSLIPNDLPMAPRSLWLAATYRM